MSPLASRSRSYGRGRQIWMVLAALFVLLSLVAGCARTSPPADASAPAPAQEPVTLRVVIFNYDPGVQAFWDNLAKEFKALHPHVTVNIEAPPINEVHDRLVADVGANNAPDLSQGATAWMAEFADAGQLEDWGEHLDSSLLDNFVGEFLDTGKYDGKLYGLPYLATTRALYINTALFTDAGVSPPTTWDEFVTAAQAVNSPPDHYALAMQGTGNEAFAAWFLYWLWSFGGDVYDSQGNLAINSPEGVAALEYMGKLVTEYKVVPPDVISTDVPEQLSIFKSGQAAATITGPWMIGIMKAEAPDVPYQIVPIPRGKEQVTLGVTDSLMMFKSARKPEAVAFAQFFMESQNHLEYVKGRGMLPVLQDVAADPYFSSDPNLKVHVDLLPTARFAPNVAEWPRIIEEGRKALQAVYLGQKTPQQALDEAVQAIEAAR